MFLNDEKKRATTTYNEKYNEDVQRVILNMLLSDPEGFVLCRTIIQDIYFDDQLRPAVQFIMEYSDEHKRLPAIEQVRAKSGVAVEKFSEGALHTRALAQEVESFCQYKAMELAVLEGVQLLQTGRAGEIVERTKSALSIRLMTDIGTDYYGDPAARLLAMQDKSAFVSTGWSALDRKLFGGFTRGGLNIFAGNSGCVIAGTKVRVIKLRNI